MLEVKETFEEEDWEVAFAGAEDDDVAPAELDAVSLEDELEGALAAGVEELDGAAVDCGAVDCAGCEVGVGVGLAAVGAALDSAVVAAGVVTGA